MAKRKQPIFLNTKPYIVSFLSDYGFKVTFGDKENTLFARKAIELIIGETQPIKSLKYLRNEFQGISVNARTGIFDVISQDEHKRVFIIEMQVDNYENLLERLQFYAFHVFTSLAKKGNKGFHDMGVVHCICILKGTITESVNYHQTITLKNEDNEIVMDNIVFHLIELGKFSIAQKAVSKITTEKEELFYTMKYAHKFDPLKNTAPAFWDKDYFKVALQRLDTSKMSALDVALYENALLRAKTEADKAQQVMEEKVNKAVEEKVTQAKKLFKEEIKNEVQNELKTEAIKKQLLRGKLTIEEIAEDMEVNVDFVKSVEKSLKVVQKQKAKPRATKKTIKA